MKIPFEPLARYLAIRFPDADYIHSGSQPKNETCGVSESTWDRYQSLGTLPSIAADEIAVRLGVTPVDIWPDWFDWAADEPMCVWCSWPCPMNITGGAERKYCTEACRRARSWWRGDSHNGTLAPFDALRLARQEDRIGELSARIAVMVDDELEAFLGIESVELATAA